jgi:glutamate 5-kinase
VFEPLVHQSIVRIGINNCVVYVSPYIFLNKLNKENSERFQWKNKISVNSIIKKNYFSYKFGRTSIFEKEYTCFTLENMLDPRAMKQLRVDTSTPKPERVGGRHDNMQVVVIKIGTTSLINSEHSSLNLSALAGLAETVRTLKDNGCHVVLISSGAVGVGCQRLGLSKKPADLSKRQALAAIGQVHLMRFYEDMFSAVGITCSQVLLTLDNLSDKQQYANAVNTFHELLEYGVVPVVNENDTVAIEQLKIGDNDTLSAQVATLVHADWLFLLTDVDALYTANPAVDPKAKPIRIVEDVQALNVKTEMSQSDPGWGTGGMGTKISAANMATAGGTRMVICQADPEVVPRVVLEGEEIGTLFLPAEDPVLGGQRWVLSNPVRGTVTVTEEAMETLKEDGTLSAAHIDAVQGNFEAGEAVTFLDESGKEIGKALCHTSYRDLAGLLDDSTDNDALEDFVITEKSEMCLLPGATGNSDHSSASDADEWMHARNTMIAGRN